MISGYMYRYHMPAYPEKGESHRGRFGSIGILIKLIHETEKTSLVDGGPHKSHSATKLQSRWITKAESSQTFILSSEFHHIIERPFSKTLEADLLREHGLPHFVIGSIHFVKNKILKKYV